jgi:hypothetical protein
MSGSCANRVPTRRTKTTNCLPSMSVNYKCYNLGNCSLFLFTLFLSLPCLLKLELFFQFLMLSFQLNFSSTSFSLCLHLASLFTGRSEFSCLLEYSLTLYVTNLKNLLQTTSHCRIFMLVTINFLHFTPIPTNAMHIKRVPWRNV